MLMDVIDDTVEVFCVKNFESAVTFDEPQHPREVAT